MKTATIDAGKFTTMSADGITMLTGNSAGAWPANLRLADINTGGNASATNGQWTALTIASTATAPATNISVQHLKRVTGSFTASAGLLAPNGGTSFHNFTVPTNSSVGDGGNANFKFWWTACSGSLASYGGGSMNISGYVVMGTNCTDATSGVTFHAPIFFCCGTNSSTVSLQLNLACKVYSIAET